MTSDLKDKIRQEIEKTGFPLELRAANELLRRDYHVAHNVYYLDRDENKGREVDLRGLRNEFFAVDRKPYAVRHCVLVECKKSVSRPWVVFTSPSVSYDQNVLDLHCNGTRGPIWRIQTVEDYSNAQDSHPWFGRPERGRAFFEPFSSGADANQTIFKALVSVVKASIEVRRSWFGGGGRGRPSICFYYPIVVLDGLLYTATIGTAGLEIETADAVPVSLYYRSSAYSEEERYTILVVRESAFSSEIQKLDDWLAATALHLRGNKAAFELERPGRRRGTRVVTPNTRLQPPTAPRKTAAKPRVRKRRLV